MFAPFCAELANRHNVVVLSVDYRRAPEVGGHVALDESVAALGWLHREAANLGFESRFIAVVGYSAGGSLSAGVALRARDASLPLMAQFLIYPALDYAADDGAASDPGSSETVSHEPFLN